MRRLLGVMLFFAGCYRPRVPVGAACSNDGSCPSNQVCIDDFCEPLGTLPLDAATDIDAPINAPDAPDLPGSGMWTAPTKVPGVNSSMGEDDPSGTPDRLTIVFTSNRNGTDDIFLGTRPNTTASFVVAPLDTLNSVNASENSPEISADGTTIYFTSDRVTAGSGDVYVSHKIGGTWSMPALVTELSTGQDESDVAISPDELTAMVARAGKLMIATRSTTTGAFSAPADVPSLAVPGNDAAAPSITNNADAVYFHAGSVRDLYYAKRSGNAYTAPAPISELNTAMRDDGPFVSADEHHLMYGHTGDIYETSR